MSKLPVNEKLLILRHTIKKRVNSSLAVNVLTSKAKISKIIKKCLNCLFWMANSPLRHFGHFLFFKRGLWARWLSRPISKETKNGWKSRFDLKLRHFLIICRHQNLCLYERKLYFIFNKANLTLSKVPVNEILSNFTACGKKMS